MLELQNDHLVFSFPEVHPDAVLTVSIVRTLRIPDDGKKYPLPPGLGYFPARHVDDFRDKVPPRWTMHGGVMIPMYQSEAMWLRFDCKMSPLHRVKYPFAIKVATGKSSAVTGKKWSKNLKEGDYLVAPDQPWIDGYVIEDGVIRQFIAAPLGQGYTAEEQLTGKAEFGGLQIEVIPMKSEYFNKRWPAQIRTQRLDDLLRGTRRSRGSLTLGSNKLEGYTAPVYSALIDTNALSLDTMALCNEGPAAAAIPCAAVQVQELGLAPGGTMAQQIFKDQYGLDAWSETKSRCFIHLLNSMTWKSITGCEAPRVPLTASDYAHHGLPWYDYYQEGVKVASGTDKTKSLKSVAQIDQSKGIMTLPENQSIPSVPVKSFQKKVRDGVWK